MQPKTTFLGGLHASTFDTVGLAGHPGHPSHFAIDTATASNALRPIQSFMAGASAATGDTGHGLFVDAYGALNHVTGGVLDDVAQRSALPSLARLSADNARAQEALQASARHFGDSLLDLEATTRRFAQASHSLPALLPMQWASQHLQETFTGFKASLPEAPSAFEWGYGVASLGFAFLGPTRKVSAGNSIAKTLKPNANELFYTANATAVTGLAQRFKRSTDQTTGATQLTLDKQTLRVDKDGVLDLAPLTSSALKHGEEALLFSAASLRLRQERVPIKAVQTTLDLTQPTGWVRNLHDTLSTFYAPLLKTETNPDVRRLIAASAIQQVADQSPALYALDRRKPVHLSVKETDRGPVFSVHLSEGNAWDPKDLSVFNQQMTAETKHALDRLIEFALAKSGQ